MVNLNGLLKIITKEPVTPKVVFKELNLQVAIGQWLGILASQQSIKTPDYTMYTLLSADELLKCNYISKEELNLVTEKFGHLLKIIGVDNNETCVLSKYDEHTFSFNCLFKKSGENAEINLRWSNLDDAAEFNINYRNQRSTYYYSSGDNETPMRLTLSSNTPEQPTDTEKKIKTMKL